MTKKYCTFHGSWSKGYVGEGITLHIVNGSKTLCGLSIKNANAFYSKSIVYATYSGCRTIISGKCLRCFKK
jgi:hypothetical protein